MWERKAMIARAVAAVVLGAASTLLAQYQVENSNGRARDANNRLGSGGYNDTRALPNGVTSDDIVYGNVTRGLEFRGRLTSTDPTAFRGRTAGSSMDSFVRDSSGVPVTGATAAGEFQPQRYLGDARGVNPPAGFQRDSYSSGGYTPTPPPAPPSAGDLRLNAAMPNPALDDILYPATPAGDVSRLTRLSPLATASPSLSALTAGTSALAQPASTPDGDIIEMSRGTMRRLNLSMETLRSMREEVEKTATEDEGETAKPAPGALTAPENPSNSAMGTRLHGAVGEGAMSGSLRDASGLRQNLLTPLPEATLQSAQYAELQRRLKIYQEQGALTDDQVASQEYNAQLRMQQEREAAARKGSPVAVTPPGGEAAPGANVKPQTGVPLIPPTHGGRRAAVIREHSEGTERGPGMVGKLEGPMRVTSFAEGIKAPRLRAMMQGAETAMREGKFTAALDQYDAAAAVAPNNPIILMGRASAELGAGYYARAEAHIEQIFASDQAMLLAQYDLRRFFGEERLQYLVRDLKDVAKNEPNQSQPLFLLAFIAYNSNSPQLAADYLSAAEQRGGKLPIYAKLRQFWKLPQPGAKDTPDNK